MIQSDVQLDAKGLACPMPIVKTKKAMNDVAEGQVLEVQATDSGSVVDLAAWSKKSGHQYIGSREQNGVYFHYIRKCSESNERAEQTFKRTATNEEALASSAIILDVREAAEFAFGHIPKAKSIPLGELEARLDELNKDEAIYVICRTGTRSDMAAQQLAQAGFTNVFNVLPGMSGYDGELQKDM